MRASAAAPGACELLPWITSKTPNAWRKPFWPPMGAGGEDRPKPVEVRRILRNIAEVYGEESKTPTPKNNQGVGLSGSVVSGSTGVKSALLWLRRVKGKDYSPWCRVV